MENNLDDRNLDDRNVAIITNVEKTWICKTVWSPERKLTIVLNIY